MRIRQVKPDYWRDSRLHNTRGITAEVREFYIGLWGCADDYGWFRWDIPEVASELYRYRTPRRREVDAVRWMDALVGIGRVQLQDCGHGFLPNLTKHQKVGGTKSQTYLLEHQRCEVPPSSRTSPDIPPTSASNGKGKGTVGNVTESNGRPDENFENALARAKAKSGEVS